MALSGGGLRRRSTIQHALSTDRSVTGTGIQATRTLSSHWRSGGCRAVSTLLALINVPDANDRIAYPVPNSMGDRAAKKSRETQIRAG